MHKNDESKSRMKEQITVQEVLPICRYLLHRDAMIHVEHHILRQPHLRHGICGMGVKHHRILGYRHVLHGRNTPHLLI